MFMMIPKILWHTLSRLQRLLWQTSTSTNVDVWYHFLWQVLVPRPHGVLTGDRL
jgi:hypothetical protein